MILLFQCFIYAQTNGISTSEDDKTLIIEDAKDSEILAFGKNVIVKKHAKGVFAFCAAYPLVAVMSCIFLFGEK